MVRRVGILVVVCAAAVVWVMGCCSGDGMESFKKWVEERGPQRNDLRIRVLTDTVVYAPEDTVQLDAELWNAGRDSLRVLILPGMYRLYSYYPEFVHSLSDYPLVCSVAGESGNSITVGPWDVVPVSILLTSCEGDFKREGYEPVVSEPMNTFLRFDANYCIGSDTLYNSLGDGVVVIVPREVEQ